SSSPWLEEALVIDEGNILKTDLLESGEVTVQDTSSMLAAKAVEAEPGMIVLDTCSAPGGKTTFLGEVRQGKGESYAYASHQNKLNLIRESASRRGITNIHTGAKDARSLQSVQTAEPFERVLSDAPCSGCGVIRSKPDIKSQKAAKAIVQ